MQIKETYTSISEIKELASIILKVAASRSFQEMNEKQKFVHINSLQISDIDILEKNKGKFKEILNFLEHTNIRVYFMFKNSKSYADYTVFAGKYEGKDEREINLYYQNDFIDKMNGYFNKSSDTWTPGFNEFSLYSSLYFKFNSPLVHELQHAYDDFRSKGKALQTKQFKKYYDKYYQGQSQEIADDLERGKTYLNLPHEIWARFSQAMIQVHFYSIEFKGENEEMYMHHFMLPIIDVTKQFKREFGGWHVLSDAAKKKLINKVVQFWHFEQDKIKQKNAEEQKKLADKKFALAEVRKIVRSVLSEEKKSKPEEKKKDEIFLPELAMEKKELLKYLKDLYNIQLK